MNKRIKRYYSLRKKITRKKWGGSYYKSLEEYATGKKWKIRIKPMFWELLNGPFSELAKNKKQEQKIYRDFRIKNIIFGISSSEYFYKRYFNKSIRQCNHIISEFRVIWLNKTLNQRSERSYLSDKAKFAIHWKDYFGRKWCDKRHGYEEFAEIFKGISKVIVKPKNGTMGQGISVFELKDSPQKVLTEIKKQYESNYIVEEYYEQTGFMHNLNPSSLNTIRVITIRKDKEIWPVSAYARVGLPGAIVDNYSSGGVLYSIDLKTGKMCEWISKSLEGGEAKFHPGTKNSYSGLMIPRWGEIIEFCRRAHEIAPKGLDFIGWDVGVSEEEIILVEGNSWPECGINTGRHDNQWKRVLPALDRKY